MTEEIKELKSDLDYKEKCTERTIEELRRVIEVVEKVSRNVIKISTEDVRGGLDESNVGKTSDETVWCLFGEINEKLVRANKAVEDMGENLDTLMREKTERTLEILRNYMIEKFQGEEGEGEEGLDSASQGVVAALEKEIEGIKNKGAKEIEDLKSELRFAKEFCANKESDLAELRNDLEINNSQTFHAEQAKLRLESEIEELKTATHEKSKLNLSLKSEIRGLKAENLETSNLRETLKIEIDTLAIDYEDLLRSLKSQIDNIVSAQSPDAHPPTYSPSNLSTDSNQNILYKSSHHPHNNDSNDFSSPDPKNQNPDSSNNLKGKLMETPRFIDYHNSTSTQVILEALQKEVEKIQNTSKHALQAKKNLEAKILEMEEIIASNDSNLENKRLVSKNSELEDTILTLKDKCLLLRDEIGRGSGLVSELAAGKREISAV